MRENQESGLAPEDVSVRLLAIRPAMSACIDRGIRSEMPELPGGLRVRRRALAIHRMLVERQDEAPDDPLTAIDWVNLWAFAVN